MLRLSAMTCAVLSSALALAGTAQRTALVLMAVAVIFLCVEILKGKN